MDLFPDRKPKFDWVLNDKISKLIRRKAYTLSRSPGFSRSDEPDIAQELRLHLLRKAAKFESTRAQQSTFAARILKNKTKSMQRAAMRHKRDWRRQVSIDADTENGDGVPVCLAQTIDDFDGRRHTGQRSPSETELAQLKLDIADANQNLSPSLRDMAALLSHVPPFAAAQVLGISRRQAALHVDTLRECYAERGLVV